jgi:hypothetical protein
MSKSVPQNDYHKDFLGFPLDIGDFVAYRDINSGYLVTGTVIGLTAKSVRIERGSTRTPITRQSQDVIKLNAIKETYPEHFL